MAIYVIEDEMHSEQIGEFQSYESALAELTKLAALGWDQPPNPCPCQNWQNCGRNYEIVEYDDEYRPWKELNRTPQLRVSAKDVLWVNSWDDV